MSELAVPASVMQAWREACGCWPAHLRPCEGVMAGGMCDGLDWRIGHEAERDHVEDDEE